MGYGYSQKSIETVSAYLDILLNAKGPTFFSTDAPTSLIYKLHRALGSAEKFNHPMYKELKKQWRLREKDNGILAEPRTSLSVDIVCKEATDALDVVSYLINIMDKAYSVAFPNVPLDEIDMIHEFTRDKNLIIEKSRLGIVVKRRN